jgi:hypothetical protein
MELLSKALEEAEHESLEWIDFSLFLKSTFEWWKGQKQILFYDSPLSGLEDIIMVLDRCLHVASILGLCESIDKSSLRQVLLGIMVLQKHGLESRKALESPIVDLVYY